MHILRARWVNVSYIYLFNKHLFSEKKELKKNMEYDKPQNVGELIR